MVTQKCHKVPEVYAKKVPREECREVPGVNCYLELELVETPKCYPVPVEECDDILKVGKISMFTFYQYVNIPGNSLSCGR